MNERTYENVDAPSPRGKRKRKKAPPPISQNDFQRAAARHLDRYSASVAGLRAVLERRAWRSAAHHGGHAREADGLIESVVNQCIELGLVDDTAYGRALVRRIRNRGGSLRRVQSELIKKGVPHDICGDLLRELKESDTELETAQIYARRRRLGPHRRPPEKRDEYRQKDLAAMARAGFPSSIIMAVLDSSRQVDPDA